MGSPRISTYFNYICLIIYLIYALLFYINSCPCNTTFLRSADSLNTHLFTLTCTLYFTTHTTTLLLFLYHYNLVNIALVFWLYSEDAFNKRCVLLIPLSRSYPNLHINLPTFLISITFVKFKAFLLGYILIHSQIFTDFFLIASLPNILIRQFWLLLTQKQAARPSLHSSPKLLAPKFFQPYCSPSLISCTDNSVILVNSLEFPVVKKKKQEFLGAFEKLRRATTSPVLSVRPSVRPHERSRLPLDGSS